MSGGYYLLLDARWCDPNLGVSSIFKIFPHTLEDINKHDPLQVLQYFAQEFGHTFVIGDQYNRYIYNSKFSIPKIRNKDELMLSEFLA